MDQLAYIGDLINIEGPLLSLLRTPRKNWLLLWCDTDGLSRHRYWLQSVSRSDLIDYLGVKKTLRQLLLRNEHRYILDVTGSFPLDALEKGGRIAPARRILREASAFAELEEYLPADDSFFDADLSPDFTAATEFVPKRYDVEIDGDWFANDLQKFSAVYEQLYDFFYCTSTEFVTNIGSRVRDYLRAPWRGGFSRVNLFRALKNFVPSLHDLRIKEIEYASPGRIRFEALESLGAMIKRTTSLYAEQNEELLELERKLGQVLTGHRLKTNDVSHYSDSELGLAKETISFIRELQDEVAERLECVQPITAINEQSPNSVISAKVVVAFLVRIKKLSLFEAVGLVGGGGNQMSADDRRSIRLLELQ